MSLVMLLGAGVGVGTPTALHAAKSATSVISRPARNTAPPYRIDAEAQKERLRVVGPEVGAGARNREPHQ